MDVVLDGAVEIGFADTDGQNRCVKASPMLFADVFYLFEQTVAYKLPQGSHTLVDREADSIPNGPDRLHRLHLHLNGGSGNGFRPLDGTFGILVPLASLVVRPKRGVVAGTRNIRFFRFVEREIRRVCRGPNARRFLSALLFQRPARGGCVRPEWNA